jgi:hypothetical protein
VSWGTKPNKQSIPSPVEWVHAPEWLTIEQACHLSGWSHDQMLEIIEEGGVDLKDDDEILVDKESLEEYQEAVVEVKWFLEERSAN